MRRNGIKYLAIVLFVIFIVSIVYSKNGKIFDGAIKSVMMEMENENYSRSISMIDDLMEKSPDDYELKYLKAVCLIELNKNLDEAVTLLLSANANLDKNDINYYLGMAYQRQYDFQNAIQTYNAYLVNLSKKEVEESDITNILKECLLSIESTKTGNIKDLKEKQIVKTKDIPIAINKYISGVVINKPTEFLSKADEKYPETSLMYMPENAEKADYLFFSAKVRGRDNHKNIFRVAQLVNGAIGEPEDLGDIVNTEGDEIFPYYDAEKNELYFASNGHLGMGGFDIFKTQYNSESNTWTEPVNIDFPYNTPYNDFFYVEDKNMGNVVFVSDRETAPKELTVYSTNYETEVKNRMFKNKEELQLASLFLKEMPKKQQMETTSAENNIVNIPEKVSPGNALRLQLKADSIGLLIKLKNIEMRSAEDEQKKSILALEIGRLEQKRQFLVEMAAKKKKEAQSNPAQANNAVAEQPEVNVQPKTAVYKEDENKTEIAQTKEIKKGTEAASKFEVLAVSPYSKENPIQAKPDKSGQVCYLIQLGVFSKKIDAETYGGISPIYYQNLEERDLIKYYAGEFISVADARKALQQVKTLGYKDAFIVAEYNNESIDLEKATSME